MSRDKGRGRRGGRRAQETLQTHQSRNPTSSTVVSEQRPLSFELTSNNPSTSTGLSDPLGQYGMEFDSFCSESTSKAGFSDPLGQYTTEFDNFCAKHTSEVEGHQQIDSHPPSHEGVDGNSQPASHEYLQTSEAIVVPLSGQKSEAVDVPLSGQCLSDDMTELDEDMFEAPSSYDLEYEHVCGHIVKKEISGLVGAIFEKYGDITRESDVRSLETISFCLERICGVYQRLEQTAFFDLTSADINAMLDELRDLAKQKLNVGWLLEKVEQISETVSSFQNYSTNEREAAEYVKSNGRIDEAIEQYRKQIAVIQEKISLAEEEKVANEAKAIEHTKMAVDCYAKVKSVANESLVHGLL